MAERRVPLGEIATTHGLDGWLKFNPHNPHTTALVAGQSVELALGKTHETLALAADAKPFKNQFLIKLRGIDSIDSAARWAGATLSVDESALAPLQPGEFYHYQVIGFEVYQNNGARIGIIEALLATAANDIFVIKDNDKEYLVPAIKEFVDKVDFEARRLIVDVPPGLLDL